MIRKLKHVLILFVCLFLVSCQTLNTPQKLSVTKSVQAKASSEKIKKQFKELKDQKKQPLDKRVKDLTLFIKNNQNETDCIRSLPFKR